MHWLLLWRLLRYKNPDAPLNPPEGLKWLILVPLAIIHKIKPTLVDGRKVPLPPLVMSSLHPLRDGAHVLHMALAVPEVVLRLYEALLRVIALDHRHMV